MRPRRGHFAFLLALVAPALAPATFAQSGGDPFAKRHVELLRAADAHITALRTQPAPAFATIALAGAEANAGQAPLDPRDPLAAFPVERVERAGKRLQALGVDAARIFAEEGVPLFLLVVAEVESGFNPAALSSKGARGLWQLMPETARRFGLRVDEQVDERRHASRSTRAAARYLRELYLLFGDWELALAAYNAGEQRVTSAIKRAGGRAFAQLASLLPEETRRYVPAVLRGWK